MKKTIAFFELHSKKIEITTGVVSVLTSAVGFLGQFAAWELLISIVLIGVFFVLKSILNEKRNSPKNTRSIRVLYWLNFLLIPIALGLGIFWYINKNKPSCSETHTEPVVCIARFSNQEDDDFSYALVSDLADRIKENDSINIASIDTFLNQSVFFDLNSLENLIDMQCHEKGLVVFGKYSGTTNLFNCSIYVSKKFESKYADEHLIDNQLVKLKNPDEITFSIQSHSKLVTDIVLMLLDYYNGDLTKCISTINDLLSTNTTLSVPLQKLLLVYVSNAQALSGDMTSSLSGYEELLALDSLSDIANYNYALLLLEKGDSTGANSFFEKAKSINPSLENPILKESVNTNNVKTIDSNVDESAQIETPEKKIDTIASTKPIVEQPKKEISSAPVVEKKIEWSQFPRNCKIKKVSETNFIVYDLKDKKLGQYNNIWPAESRELKNLQKQLNTSFYYVLRDGYYGAVDDNGRIIMRPAFEDKRTLDQALLEAFGQK